MRPFLVEPHFFEPIWRLYFNPLSIQSATCYGDPSVAEKAIDKLSFTSYNGSTMEITWSDERTDVYADGKVFKRKRVDSLVYLALDECCDKEKLLSLLKKINLRCLTSQIPYVITAWLNLFDYLINKLPRLFDEEIKDLLFEYLNNINIYNRIEAISRLLQGLSKYGSNVIINQLDRTSQTLSLTPSMISLVDKLMNCTSDNKYSIYGELIQHICTNTPANNNNQGTTAAYVLLDKILSECEKSSIPGEMLRIDIKTLCWYIDFVISNNSENALLHKPILLSIFKCQSMYTQDDLIQIMIERIVANPNQSLNFQLLKDSGCPSNILTTYVLNTSKDLNRLVYLLDVINLPQSDEYLPICLLIIEALIENVDIQEHLLTLNISSILQTRLNRHNSQWPITSIIRLIHLLLKITSIASEIHKEEIARFFLDIFEHSLIKLDFQNESPLARIILYHASILESKPLREPSSLIATLFKYLNCNDDKNSTSICVSHLRSLTKEIVEQSSRKSLVSALSSFIPDLMNLLTFSDELKTIGVILLSEVLDLTSDERGPLIESNYLNESIGFKTDRLAKPINTQHMFFSAEKANEHDYAMVSKGLIE